MMYLGWFVWKKSLGWDEDDYFFDNKRENVKFLVIYIDMFKKGNFFYL